MAGEPAQALKYTVWPLACASMARHAGLSGAKALDADTARTDSRNASAKAGLAMRAKAWRRGIGFIQRVSNIRPVA